MKKVAIVLWVLVVILGGAFMYQLFSSRLVVTGVAFSSMDAKDNQALFDTFSLSVNENHLNGTIISREALKNAEDHVFYTYTLRLKNKSLFPAEMVEIQLPSVHGDVLYYGQNQKSDIHALQEEEVYVILLTSNGQTPVRELYITYYILGRPHQMKYTFDHN